MDSTNPLDLDVAIELGRLRRSGSLPEYADKQSGFCTTPPDSVTQLSADDRQTLAAIDRWKENPDAN